MNFHESMYGKSPRERPRPIVTFITLFFIPIAFEVSTYFVREASYDDFLGFDIRHAVTRTHLVASAASLALSIWALHRHERYLLLAYSLLIVSCLWLALSATVGA